MTNQSQPVPARVLAGVLEPVAGHVYFSPECHELYAGLGFSASPGVTGQVALPDGPAYFCSRGSVLGQVPGEVVAAAFGVFNPAVVVPAVAYGWSITNAPTICAARTEGAIGQLRRILGSEPDGLAEATALLHVASAGLRPEGKPLYAGLLALGLPGDPLGAVWRLTDLLREFRGDAHIAAWSAAGFDATEIGLATEQYWGVPSRSFVRAHARLEHGRPRRRRGQARRAWADGRRSAHRCRSGASRGRRAGDRRSMRADPHSTWGRLRTAGGIAGALGLCNP
jgi:hypothetical protein